jgi:hypothetical protein
MKTRSIVVLSILLLTGSTAFALGPVWIPGVPDWNHPNNYMAVPDSFVQPWDPPPGLGGVNNWCTPSATANIMGWYEDTQGASFSGMGDGINHVLGNPNRVQPYPNLHTDGAMMDGLPDYQQNQWMDGSIELGYYMDTQGWKNNVAHSGTMMGNGVADIPNGIMTYMNTYAPTTQWSVWDYDIFNGGVIGNGFADLQVGGYTPILPAGSSTVVTNGVLFNEPVLVHWSHWIDQTQFKYDDGTNRWWSWLGNLTEEGHTVTGIGFAINYDPDGLGPVQAQDWVIVHDDWPGTGNANTGNIAVPYWFGTGQTYWEGNTHLEFLGVIPEPGTAVLLALGGVTLWFGGRRSRR